VKPIVASAAVLALLLVPLSVEAQVASVTTLSVSPSPAASGEVVTLQATVTHGGATALVGTVTFWEETDRTRALGTVQVVGADPASGFTSGTATLKARFTRGDHRLTAIFNPLPTVASSTSAPHLLSVVSGATPSRTTLEANFNGTNYDLTAKIFGYGVAPPYGFAYFNDNTSASSLGNVYLDGGLKRHTFQPARLNQAGSGAQAITAADFNVDGTPDLAVANSYENSVSVLLGDPAAPGYFQTQSMYPVGNNPSGIVAGDFNADGLPDLAVTNGSDSTVGILLGDPLHPGEFQPQQVHPVGLPETWPNAWPKTLVVGDFNRDGVADLAVSNTNETTISVLLGDPGDPGNFQAQQLYDLVDYNAYSLTIADFDGDGIQDLAAADYWSMGGVNVLLGNGDGSFEAPQWYDAGGSYAEAIAAGDLNGDTFQDLVLADYNNWQITVLPGLGNGTFDLPQSYALNDGPYAIAIADFNGDGRLDIATAYWDGGGTEVLLGNAGGFDEPQYYDVRGYPYGLVAQDFNSDRAPDLAFANPDDYSATVLMGGIEIPAQLLGVAITDGHMIQASYAPIGAPYSPSESEEISVGQSLQWTWLDIWTNGSTYGDAFSATAQVATQTDPPIGTITYQIDGGPSQQATVTNGEANLLLPAFSAGNHYITASYSGDSVYNPTNYETSIWVNKAPLTVTPNNHEMYYGGPAPAVTFTIEGFVNGETSAVLRGTPGYSTDADPMTLGSYNIWAEWGTLAAANYEFTNFGTGMLNVVPAPLTITANSASRAYGTANPALGATYSGFAGGEDASVLTGILECTTTATASSPVSGSPYPVTCSGQTSSNYAISYVPGHLTVMPVATSTALAASAADVLENSPVTFTATVTGAGATGTVNFTDSGSPLGSATLDAGGVATLTTSALAGGTHSIGASYAGDGNFTASSATPVTVSVTIPAPPSSPLPVISSLSPTKVEAGSAGFTLTVNGANFISGMVARWNGSDRATTLVSPSQLTAAITAADVAAAGVADVTVFDPAPGGGTSSAFKFVTDTPAGQRGGFTVSSTTLTLDVVQGQSGSVQVNLNGAAAGALVTAACLNLPAGATCTYDPNTRAVTVATLGTTPRGSYQLIVVFTAVQQIASARPQGIFLAAWIGLTGLPIGLLWIAGRRKQAAPVYIITILALVLLAGCGGSPTPPPAAQTVTTQSSTLLGLNVN
jgi:hypothetical protein